MRTAEVSRKTGETDIYAELNLDGKGRCEAATGVPFFDHMIHAMTRHGFFDLTLRCKGDPEVDAHHTVEDCGIVLGKAFKEALGGKEGIARFGSSIVPMDDALILCAVDLSGRAYFAEDLPFTVEKLGTFDTEVIREFFLAFASNAEINLHIRKIAGINNHHVAEAAFKAFGRALRDAVSIDERVEGVLSTKGSLS